MAEVNGSTYQPSRRNWHQMKMPTRSWTTSEVPIFPFAQWLFLSRNMSRILYWLQLASATTCVVLSSMKLINRNYGEIQQGDTDKRNRESALNIFYGLALSEALFFLIEKAYWEWKVVYCKLLEDVNKECESGPLGMVSIRQFFYDAFSKCVSGSIFDGLRMDIVSFGMELLASNSRDEQLIRARILRQFAEDWHHNLVTYPAAVSPFSSILKESKFLKPLIFK